MTKREREAALNQLMNNPLFVGVEESFLVGLLEKQGLSLEKVRRGESILTPERYARRLGLVVKGTVRVKKGEVVMSTLRPGELFGAVLLYSEEAYYVTHVSAVTDASILFIEGEVIDELLETSPRIAKNLIAYLTRRIYFLNHKIEGFTSQSASKKLALFLLDLTEEERSVCLPFSLTQLSERLNVSRASLYRAFEELEQNGVLSRQGKQITVHRWEQLKEFC